MKTLVLAAAALAFATSAFAAEMEGTIKEVDPMKHMITMQDGMSIMTMENVMLDQVKPGDTVKIMTDDKNMAISVEKKM